MLCAGFDVFTWVTKHYKKTIKSVAYLVNGAKGVTGMSEYSASYPFVRRNIAVKNMYRITHQN